MPPIVPVTVHNPWLVNDRVADTHNLSTIAACYVNAYTPDGVVPPANSQAKAMNYNNQKRRLYHWADEPPSVGGNSISDPTYNQNVFGWGLCGRHADQSCTIANAVGFGQRRQCPAVARSATAVKHYRPLPGGVAVSLSVARPEPPPAWTLACRGAGSLDGLSPPV